MEDISYKLKGPVRPREIQISYEHWQALGYIARSAIDPELSTRDGIVSQILETWLRQHHPKIVQWIEKRSSDEKVFLKTLKPIPFEDKLP